MSKKIASLLSASALLLAMAIPATAAGGKAPAQHLPRPVHNRLQPRQWPRPKSIPKFTKPWRPCPTPSTISKGCA